MKLSVVDRYLCPPGSRQAMRCATASAWRAPSWVTSASGWPETTHGVAGQPIAGDPPGRVAPRRRASIGSGATLLPLRPAKVVQQFMMLESISGPGQIGVGARRAAHGWTRSPCRTAAGEGGRRLPASCRAPGLPAQRLPGEHPSSPHDVSHPGSVPDVWLLSSSGWVRRRRRSRVPMPRRTSSDRRPRARRRALLRQPSRRNTSTRRNLRRRHVAEPRKKRSTTPLASVGRPLLTRAGAARSDT